MKRKRKMLNQLRLFKCKCNDNNSITILYYLFAVSTATRPITDVAQRGY
jgi:hypothetical protein